MYQKELEEIAAANGEMMTITLNRLQWTKVMIACGNSKWNCKQGGHDCDAAEWEKIENAIETQFDAQDE